MNFIGYPYNLNYVNIFMSKILISMDQIDFIDKKTVNFEEDKIDNFKVENKVI